MIIKKQNIVTKLSFLIDKWYLVFCVVGITGVLVAIILIGYGVDEKGLTLCLRVTGRTDVIPFTAAFIASSLNRVHPNIVSTWLVKNRRFLGISFALQHLFFHIPIAIWLLVVANSSLNGFIYSLEGEHIFVIGALLIAAMLITSFEKPTRWLGYWRWKILHKIGLFYVMFLFLWDFKGGVKHISVLNTPFVMLLLGAIVLRVVAFVQKLS